MTVSRPDTFALPLLAAPHRLLFFVGAANVLVAMAWWAAHLLDTRWQVFGLPTGGVFAGWVHAVMMQYQLLPPFMFGFLLTVFPRWMGLPELSRRHYLPVGIGLFGGQVLAVTGGFFANTMLIATGWVLSLGGWLFGWAQLGRLLLAERRAGKGPTWHAWSCFAAMTLGALGLACALMHALGGSVWWMFVAIKLGTFGLLLPVYATVAHRMFPFFASNVVEGYVAWRPTWWLAALWGFAIVHLVLELAHAYPLLVWVDAPFAAFTAWTLWRWWPRNSASGLLWVLFLGFAWLPLALSLYAVQSLLFANTGEFLLGRGPAHALFIGFFGSLLVAMVTRVTQGHSGRPLAMPRVGWFAFVAIQAVTVLRLLAEVATDAGAWNAIAALGWLCAFLPWVLRSTMIYLRPRVDGKPG